MRHRWPAERRQVDPLQCADANGSGRGSQLSVLHDRAECRGSRRSRSRGSTRWPRSARAPQVIPTRLTFVDIAGLVRGASKGEGLGNKFLSHIREVDAVAYVLRCFVDEDVTHVENRIDPLADADVVETELMLADLESLEKRASQIEKKAKTGDKEAKAQFAVIEKPLQSASRGQARAPGADDAGRDAGVPRAAAVDVEAGRLRLQCRRKRRSARKRLFQAGRGTRQGRRRCRGHHLSEDRKRVRGPRAGRSRRIPERDGTSRAGPQPPDPRRLRAAWIS